MSGKQRSSRKHAPTPSVQAPEHVMPHIFPGLSHSSQSLMVESIHAGPLPPPETLGAYDRVEQGAAGRIITMAEAEQKHRHACESSLIAAQIEDAQANRSAERRGQWLALIMGLTICAAGVFALWLGHTGTASIVLGGVLATVVGIFITRKIEARVPSEQDPQQH